MSIEKIRSSLNSDDLKKFDTALSNLHLADNVSHDVVDFTNTSNFVIKSTYDTKPYTGLVLISDGNIATCVA